MYHSTTMQYHFQRPAVISHAHKVQQRCSDRFCLLFVYVCLFPQRCSLENLLVVSIIVVSWSHFRQVVGTDRFHVVRNLLPAPVFLSRVVRVDDDEAVDVDDWKRNLLVYSHHAPTPVTLFAVDLAAQLKVLELLRRRVWLYDNVFLVSK